MTISGRHVLIALLGFFAVTFAVNGALIVSALRTFSGMDEPKSYVQGARYDEVLKRRAEQRALAWQADVTAFRTGDVATITLAVRDARGNAVGSLPLKAKLEHPASAKHDLPLSFTQALPGRYEASTKGVSKGEWILVVTSDETGATGPFELRRKLWLP